MERKKKYLSQYELEFSESVSKGYKEVHFSELVDAIRKAKIVLFGDFHTLANSQGILIDTIKSYREFSKKTKIVIALECFSTHDKKYIDQYLKEEISEQEFLLKTGYHTGWGFPWVHYKRIFDYAQEINAEIIPINNPLYTVHVRDQKISHSLVKQIKKSADDSKIFCLIGEFHLAERHLPVELKQRMPHLSIKESIVKILVNVDSYFFEHKLNKVPERATVLSLARSYYCILDTPPWIKWLTYRLWQDQDNHENLERFSQKFLATNEYCFLDLENDDLEYKIVQHAKVLAKHFSVQVHLDDFYSYNFIQFDEHNLSQYNLNSFEKTLVLAAVKDNDCYICEKNKKSFIKGLL